MLQIPTQTFCWLLLYRGNITYGIRLHNPVLAKPEIWNDWHDTTAVVVGRGHHRSETVSGEH